MTISKNQPMREAEIDTIDVVNSLSSTIGDSSSGLVKDVSDLKTTVGNSSSGLVKDVSDLKTTVGDSSSGLVKDVSDLETTVGDSSSGLVKDVSDLENVVSDIIHPSVKQIGANSTRNFTIDSDSDLGLIAVARGSKKALFFINRIDANATLIGDDDTTISIAKTAQERTGTITNSSTGAYLIWVTPNITIGNVVTT